MTPEERAAQLEAHFHQVREIIRAEEMWERVPERAREFSPENLEGLVKFAYFGGFIDMAGVRRLLGVDKPACASFWSSGTRRSGSRAAGSANRSVMTRRRGVHGEARPVKPRLTSKPGRPGVGPLPFQSQGVSKTPGACPGPRGAKLADGRAGAGKIILDLLRLFALEARPLAATSAMVAKPKENPRKMPPIKIARTMAVSPCRLNFMGRWVLVARKIKLVRLRPSTLLSDSHNYH